MDLQPVGPKIGNSQPSAPSADLPPGAGGAVRYPTFREYHARRPAFRAFLTRVMAAGTVGGLAFLAGCSDESPAVGGTPLPGAKTRPVAQPMPGIMIRPAPPVSIPLKPAPTPAVTVKGTPPPVTPAAAETLGDMAEPAPPARQPR